MNQPLFKAKIGDFKEHPAQMRTLYDLSDMANLTLQVYDNDLDNWQPIVATRNPEGGYFVISGHRRRMARLFAFAISTWLDQPDSADSSDVKEIGIELVQNFISTLVSKYEFVDAAAEVLTEHYADQEIEFVLFSGSQKAQILALQRANYGMVKPDMLGIAYSFQAALEAGANIAEIARNAGQHVHYVRNHLALTKIPQELAERIADGALPMSIGIAVSDIPQEHKRNGLALFVLSNPPEQLTAKAVKEVAKALKKWDGLQLPLTAAHQAERNIARTLTSLWHSVVDAYPTRSWAVISSFIYQGTNIHAPWEDQKSLETWFQTMGGEHYYAQYINVLREDGIQWENVVSNLLLEVNCDTCPIAKLPNRQLRSDLSPGRSDVLGMPCRSGSCTRCIHGLAPSDPFHVRVPWDWADHEGVIKESSGYVVQSFDALQKAWQAQADLEDAEDEEARQAEEAARQAEEAARQTEAAREVAAREAAAQEAAADAAAADAAAAREAAAQEAVSPAAQEAPRERFGHSSLKQPPIAYPADPREEDSPTEGYEPAVVSQPTEGSEPTLSDDPLSVNMPVSESTALEPAARTATNARTVSHVHHATPPAPSPIQKMRKRFASFMTQHLTMNIDHPFATPCAKCQHQLEASPTKDESVPHCAWTSRQRFVEFLVLEPIEGGKSIPVCRQFAPKGRWVDIIPAHPQKAIMPREWIKHQLHQIVKSHPYHLGRKLFEFLTGRPMSSNEKHDGWFWNQVKEQGHDLSDEQWWTLLVWGMAEWRRCRATNNPFMVPADGQNEYFISLWEINFPQ